jgi:hypothetical protein
MITSLKKISLIAIMAAIGISQISHAAAYQAGAQASQARTKATSMQVSSLEGGWTGKWDTNYGPVYIISTTGVCGRYKYDQGSLTECQLSGSTLSGRFIDVKDNQQGTFQFDLQNNGIAFKGMFRVDGDTVNDAQSWNGKRSKTAL